MKNFKEFEVKNLQQITGGNEFDYEISSYNPTDPSGAPIVILSLSLGGFMDGVKHNTKLHGDVLGNPVF